MDDKKYRQDQQQEEEEETLSLSDLPLNTDDDDDGEKFTNLSDRRTSSDPTALFEFFSDLNSEMSHAEDIFSGGKLRPFNENSLPDKTHKKLTKKEEKLQSFHSRRCESMSELKSTQPESAKTRVIRNSRSLDYQKLHRTLSSNSAMSDSNRGSFNKSSGKFDGSGQKVSKPRWYVLMFGFVKFPPEMHLRDIRNRQVRRNSAGLFQSFDAAGKFPVNRTDRKSSWGLLRVLSCKGHASVAVTASFGCMTQSERPHLVT